MTQKSCRKERESKVTEYVQITMFMDYLLMKPEIIYVESKPTYDDNEILAKKKEFRSIMTVRVTNRFMEEILKN